MDTNELNSVLHAATEDLEPRPGFTAAVVRGGRRRQLRSRIAVATSVTAATALLGSGTYTLLPDPAPTVQTAADRRLNQPTKGDLAADRAFLNDAQAAYRAGLSRRIPADLRGQPHVYWAGRTPSGPAAVIFQRYLLRGAQFDEPDVEVMLVALIAIDPADGKLKLVFETVEPLVFGSPLENAEQFQFGPGDRTILVVERDSPLWFSPGPVTDTDGRFTRDWEQLKVTDGVAIAQVPKNGRASDARVFAGPERPSTYARSDKSDDGEVFYGDGGLLFFRPSSEYLVPPPAPGGMENFLVWPGGTVRLGDKTAPLPAPEDELLRSTVSEGLRKVGLTDIGSGQGFGPLLVIAGLADGRVALVGQRTLDESPGHIYALLLNRDGSPSDGIMSGPVDPAAALPVMLRLPDGQGRIVANHGATLQYRVSPDQPWQDAGRDAALLPDDAVQVQVTRDGAPTVVDLAG